MSNSRGSTAPKSDQPKQRKTDLKESAVQMKVATRFQQSFYCISVRGSAMVPVQTIHQLFFPRSSLVDLLNYLGMTLMLKIHTMRRVEEDHMLRGWRVEATKLLCNKMIKLEDFERCYSKLQQRFCAAQPPADTLGNTGKDVTDTVFSMALTELAENILTQPKVHAKSPSYSANNIHVMSPLAPVKLVPGDIATPGDIGTSCDDHFLPYAKRITSSNIGQIMDMVQRMPEASQQVTHKKNVAHRGFCHILENTLPADTNEGKVSYVESHQPEETNSTGKHSKTGKHPAKANRRKGTSIPRRCVPFSGLDE